MTVRSKPALVASLIIAAVLAYLVGDRIVFMSRAVRTVGAVTEVSASDERCGRKGRRRCTKFTATVQFAAGDDAHAIGVGAGSARGYGQPVTYAKYRVGSRVGIVFDPRNPARAYRDTLWDVWAGPMLCLLILATPLVVTFTERRPKGDDQHQGNGDDERDGNEVTTLFGGSGRRGQADAST
jgi:hypothetical protein